MRIARHEIRDSTRLGQEPAVELAARNVAELCGVSGQNAFLIVVKEQVLTVQCEAQILVVLITDTRDKTLEVEWIR